jgi:hypothetical protein
MLSGIKGDAFYHMLDYFDLEFNYNVDDLFENFVGDIDVIVKASGVKASGSNQQALDPIETIQLNTTAIDRTYMTNILAQNYANRTGNTLLDARDIGQYALKFLDKIDEIQTEYNNIITDGVDSNTYEDSMILLSSDIDSLITSINELMYALITGAFIFQYSFYGEHSCVGTIDIIHKAVLKLKGKIPVEYQNGIIIDRAGDVNSFKYEKLQSNSIYLDANGNTKIHRNNNFLRNDPGNFKIYNLQIKQSPYNISKNTKLAVMNLITVVGIFNSNVQNNKWGIPKVEPVFSIALSACNIIKNIFSARAMMLKRQGSISRIKLDMKKNAIQNRINILNNELRNPMISAQEISEGTENMLDYHNQLSDVEKELEKLSSDINEINTLKNQDLTVLDRFMALPIIGETFLDVSNIVKSVKTLSYNDRIQIPNIEYSIGTVNMVDTSTIDYLHDLSTKADSKTYTQTSLNDYADLFMHFMASLLTIIKSDSPETLEEYENYNDTSFPMLGYRPLSVIVDILLELVHTLQIAVHNGFFDWAKWTGFNLSGFLIRNSIMPSKIKETAAQSDTLVKDLWIIANALYELKITIPSEFQCIRKGDYNVNLRDYINPESIVIIRERNLANMKYIDSETFKNMRIPIQDIKLEQPVYSKYKNRNTPIKINTDMRYENSIEHLIQNIGNNTILVNASNTSKNNISRMLSFDPDFTTNVLTNDNKFDVNQLLSRSPLPAVSEAVENVVTNIWSFISGIKQVVANTEKLVYDEVINSGSILQDETYKLFLEATCKDNTEVERKYQEYLRHPENHPLGDSRYNSNTVRNDFIALFQSVLGNPVTKSVLNNLPEYFTKPNTKIGSPYNPVEYEDEFAESGMNYSIFCPNENILPEEVMVPIHFYKFVKDSTTGASGPNVKTNKLKAVEDSVSILSGLPHPGITPADGKTATETIREIPEFKNYPNLQSNDYVYLPSNIKLTVVSRTIFQRLGAFINPTSSYTIDFKDDKPVLPVDLSEFTGMTDAINDMINSDYNFTDDFTILSVVFDETQSTTGPFNGARQIRDVVGGGKYKITPKRVANNKSISNTVKNRTFYRKTRKNNK